jgi:hypothetical protein
MLFSVELADVVLYCMQQIGVMLAVGAETIFLVAYVLSMEDKKIDDAEIRFSRAVRRALMVGVFFIVVSGIAITFLHSVLNQGNIIFSPAFLFKWFLIALLIGGYLWQRGKMFVHPLFEGFVGGTWYALFLVHILAPDATLFSLFVLYILFVAAFISIWKMITRATLPSFSLPKRVEPKPAFVEVAMAPVVTPPPIMKAPPPSSPPKAVEPPPPPPVPKAVVAVAHTTPMIIPQTPVVETPPPVIEKVELILPPPSKPPSDDPHHSHWLPAIHFMPKDQTDLDTKNHILPLASITKHL